MTDATPENTTGRKTENSRDHQGNVTRTHTEVLLDNCTSLRSNRERNHTVLHVRGYTQDNLEWRKASALQHLCILHISFSQRSNIYKNTRYSDNYTSEDKLVNFYRTNYLLLSLINKDF